MEAIVRSLLFSKKRQAILVVGDLILDEYIWGTVNRVSPEAPVQILECKAENTVLGGAANVINNLSVLGCKVYACGIVGNDLKGSILLRQLKERRVDCRGIVKEKLKPTTNKIRVIAHSQQVLRIDREDNRPISKDCEKDIIGYVKGIIKKVDGIICSDYEKGLLTKSVLSAVISEGRKHGKKVIIDPKGSDYSKYKRASIITPNEKELISATPTINPLRKDVLNARANRLLKGLQCDAVLVTRGRYGMLLAEKTAKYTNISTEAKEVYDVTGAGDTVIGVFSMCIFSGHDLTTSAKIANKAAGIVVAKVGTSVVTKDELINAYANDAMPEMGKILSRTELQQTVNRLKNQNKKIVFTNGCFDLLHVGHIKYLEDAKMLGDVLIVGLNDDRSVRRLKGVKRPLITQHQRSNILSALNCIDYVVVFSESTPDKLIKEISPDILVKGGDYAVNEVVGRDYVESYGGVVKLIPVVKDVSTSKIVKSIVDKYAGKAGGKSLT